MTDTTPKPPPDEPYHCAPLVHLVRSTLHKGTSLEERVRKLRYKRRKATPTHLGCDVEKEGVL